MLPTEMQALRALRAQHSQEIPVTETTEEYGLRLVAANATDPKVLSQLASLNRSLWTASGGERRRAVNVSWHLYKRLNRMDSRVLVPVLRWTTKPHWLWAFYATTCAWQFAGVVSICCGADNRMARSLLEIGDDPILKYPAAWFGLRNFAALLTLCSALDAVYLLNIQKRRKWRALRGLA